MGGCGCGDFSAELQMPGPDGLVYLIQVYDSCGDCDTPAGIVVHRMTPKEARSWAADRTPSVPWQEWSADYAECAIPILHPSTLKDRIVKHVEAGWKQISKRDRDADAVAEIVEEAMSEHFRDVVWATFNEKFGDKSKPEGK